MSEKRDENGRDQSGRFAAGNPGGGRKPMSPEVREMLAAATPKAAQKLIDCLEAKRAIVVGNGNGAYVEDVPDVDLQFRAANAILDRVHGKPAQTVTGEDGKPLEVVIDILGRLRKLSG